jgi:hypothetical protein
MEFADGKSNDVLDRDIACGKVCSGRRAPQFAHGGAEMQMWPRDGAGSFGMRVIGHQLAPVPMLQLVVVANDTHSPACGPLLDYPVAQDDNDVQFRVREANGAPADRTPPPFSLIDTSPAP